MSELDLTDHPSLSQICFGLRGADPAVLGDLSFRKLTLIDCSFVGVELRGTDLRGATLRDCDFRYARILGATLQNTKVVGCDFYRAYFGDGTIVAPNVLEASSFTRASLGGIVELRRQHVQPRRGDSTPPLVQELPPQRYAEFLERTAPDRFERNRRDVDEAARSRQRSDDLTTTINARFDEAAVIYRRLAALWTSQGAYSYAGWAYVRGKRMERRHVNPFRATYDAMLDDEGKIEVSKRPRQWDRGKHDGHQRHESEAGSERSFRKWLALLAADALCAFGEGFGHVLAWLAAIVVIPGLIYGVTDGVRVGSVAPTRAAGVGDSLLYSLTELVNAAPKRLHAATDAVQTASAIQTLTAVILLGLLGFVLGNKLHSA